jgi:tetratricopeptide (TPR) repeat protein
LRHGNEAISKRRKIINFFALSSVYIIYTKPKIMKSSFILLFSVGFLSAAIAQNFREDIAKLKSHVENEEYGMALKLADQLIGNRVKEEVRSSAAEVYFYRGIAKHRIGIEEDAVIDLKVALTLNSKLRDAYFYIAEIYYNLTAYSSSLENVIYFLDSKPDNIDGLALKSKCLLKLGEPMAAKLTIQKAVSIKSSEPELYYIRAAINNALGRKDLACKDANIALKFGFDEAQMLVDSFCDKAK